MKRSLTYMSLAYVLAFSIVLVSAFMFAPAILVNAQLPLPPGVPRGDVLVAENHWGTYIDIENFNFKIPGVPSTGGKYFQQLVGAYLWYVNTTNAEWINWLATGYEYSADFKSVRFYLRKGAYWNDGTPFTAHDVVYTIKTALATKEWATNAFAVTWIEDAIAEDDYTVLIKLKKPYPRFHYAFTVIIYGTGWWICPKHVWEKQDPVKFKFYPPLSIGPYNLVSVDPAGNWLLYEREENWWATKLFGYKPSPKWVLVIHHGPDEKKAMAMIRHELDCLRTLLPEAVDMVIRNNPYVIGWRREWPLAWPFDACVKGIAFQLNTYPYNITEVRTALVHAINFKKIYEAFKGPDGSLPTTSVLPIVRYIHADKDYYQPLKDELIKLGMDPETLWWRYDPAYSESLLKKVGFTKGADGKWRLPTGEPWVIHITTTSGFEMESQRIGFLVADEWRKFGIEVVVEPCESGVFSARGTKGEYEVGTFWPGCSLLRDLVPHIQWWHSKYFTPVSPGTYWAAYQFPKKAELDAIIDEMEATPPWEIEKLIELGRKALLIWAEVKPWAGFFPTPFWTLQDTYVWEGWPSYPENYYMDPVNWWAQQMFVVLRLYPTGRVPYRDALPRPGAPTPVAVTYTSVWVTEDIGSFLGADGRSYGPYKRGAYITIPTPDAERLVAAGVASYEPPALAGLVEIGETVTAIKADVTSLKDSVAQLRSAVEALKGLTAISDRVDALSREVSALAGQFSTLTMTVAAEAVVIVILAAGLILALRRRS
ncbi:MAG: ABC transporter substrate-binding protein [Candidatus Bathyarchaeia archaeon]|nr:ABC transporter substrate-binding protein [Candidatus Bathyarchaeota archaeon]